MEATGKSAISSFLVGVLNVVWYGLALVLGLLICLMLFRASVAVQIGPDGSPNVQQGADVMMTIPVSLSLDPGTLRVTSPSIPAINDAQFQDVRGSLRFPPRQGLFLPTVAVILLLGIALLLIGQLRALIRTLRDGHPFVHANAARVKNIAYLIIAGELVRASVVFWGNYYAMTHFSAEGLRFMARPHVNAFAIIDGLVILAIAEVFRAGTRLDEEQSLTV